ncbi:MAG: FxsA family protein [Planctomycetales bacterium]|nr:FxsA family protein [Planctomycetales bacterium]
MRLVFYTLLFLFIAVPFVELAILLYLASRFDPCATFLLVITTGALGAWLARRQGLHAWRRIHAELSAGTMPTDAVVDAVLIFVAGAFLMTPGVLTDAAGFFLLLPWGRRLVKRALTAWFRSRFNVVAAASGAAFRSAETQRDDGVVIDSHVVDGQPGPGDKRPRDESP